jgi:Ca-activated chloride channel family protein
MHFLAPAAFALAALLPIIVAMYLLKLRRTEQVVSSTYLWQRMVRDMEANAPWQRLRRNLLLVLQLLFLALLVVTLARPFTWAEGQAGQATILVFDTSASMSASDVAPTRLEAAKVRARQIADGLPEDARVTVIAAGQQARVLLSSSLDRRQVHLAIDGVRAGVGGSDLEAAPAAGHRDRRLFRWPRRPGPSGCQRARALPTDGAERREPGDQRGLPTRDAWRAVPRRIRAGGQLWGE